MIVEEVNKAIALIVGKSNEQIMIESDRKTVVSQNDSILFTITDNLTSSKFSCRLHPMKGDNAEEIVDEFFAAVATAIEKSESNG